jgi:serine/threonine protein phosphatase 1
MSDRLAVVGDVHGDARRLELMLAALRDRGGVQIYVGDYVDRGPASADVFDLLLDAVDNPAGVMVFLAGNHESELVNYIETGDFVRYAGVGGMATIRSYVGQARGNVHRQFLESFPRQHEALLRSFGSHYESDELLVSHAGFDPNSPTVRNRQTMVDGRFPELLTDDFSSLPRTKVVFGHYVQRDGHPFVRGGLYGIDTGCGTIAGPLTALLLPELEFVQV